MSSEPQKPSDNFLAMLLGWLLTFSKSKTKSTCFQAHQCSCCLGALGAWKSALTHTPLWDAAQGHPSCPVGWGSRGCLQAPRLLGRLCAYRGVSQGAVVMLFCSQNPSTVTFPALHLPCWQQSLAYLSWAPRYFFPTLDSQKLQGVKRKGRSYGSSKCWCPCCSQGLPLVHRLSPTQTSLCHHASATDLVSHCHEWWGPFTLCVLATWLCTTGNSAVSR